MLISSVEFLDCSARFLISSATTVNPLPASPALAASIDAFKANKFVLFAISLIVLIIFSITLDPFESLSICFVRIKVLV